MRFFKISVCLIISICALLFFIYNAILILENPQEETLTKEKDVNETYILNIKSKKVHNTDCGTAKRIKQENRKTHIGDIEYVLERGYSFCGNCF